MQPQKNLYKNISNEGRRKKEEGRRKKYPTPFKGGYELRISS
jgi:hypothetical protein